MQEQSAMALTVAAGLKLAADTVKIKLSIQETQKYRELQDMWFTAINESNAGKYSEEFQILFPLNGDRIELKIPESLSKLADTNETDDHDKYRKYIRGAQEPVARYLDELKSRWKCLQTSLPGNIYAMELVNFILIYIAPRMQAKSPSGLERSTITLTIIINFLNKYASHKDSNKRLVPCSQAIRDLSDAKKELIRIHNHLSAQSYFQSLTSEILQTGEHTLNLLLKLCFPYYRVVQHNSAKLPELLKDGIAVKRLAKGDKPVYLPESSRCFITDPLKRLAEYLYLAGNLPEDSKIDIEHMTTLRQEFALPDSEAYQLYLDTLFPLINFRYNYHPFYFGAKIISPPKKEDGSSSTFRKMTLIEFENRYLVIRKLMHVCLLTVDLSMLAKISAKTAIYEGQVNLLYSHFYSQIFKNINKIMNKIINDWNNFRKEIEKINEEISQLHNLPALKFKNIIVTLMEKIDNKLTSSHKTVINLKTLKHNFNETLTKAHQNDQNLITIFKIIGEKSIPSLPKLKNEASQAALIKSEKPNPLLATHDSLSRKSIFLAISIILFLCGLYQLLNKNSHDYPLTALIGSLLTFAGFLTLNCTKTNPLDYGRFFPASPSIISPQIQSLLQLDEAQPLAYTPL